MREAVDAILSPRKKSAIFFLDFVVR